VGSVESRRGLKRVAVADGGDHDALANHALQDRPRWRRALRALC